MAGVLSFAPGRGRFHVSDSNIFIEVDEDLRRDRVESLWKRYGAYIISAAIGIVLVVAGFVTWRHYQETRSAEEATQYMAALGNALQTTGNTAEDKAAADRLTAFAAKASDGYKTIARLQAAGLKARAGDRDQAIALYNGIASDSIVQVPYREFAIIAAVMLQVDTNDPKLLLSQIRPIADGGGSWRFSAMELAGVLAQRIGDKDTAKTMFTRIADDAEAPQTIRTRATEMLAILKG